MSVPRVFACCDGSAPRFERTGLSPVGCAACGVGWSEELYYALTQCTHEAWNEVGDCARCGLVMCSEVVAVQTRETPAEYCDEFAVHDVGDPVCDLHARARRESEGEREA